MRAETRAGTTIRRGALTHMRAHARATPDREICGALFGRIEADTRVILAAMPTANAASDPSHDYLIHARDLRRLERSARERGLEIVGFYHSHPNGSPAPSPADVAHAWPWYTYVIVPHGTSAADPTAWRLRADRSHFDPEPLTCGD